MTKIGVSGTREGMTEFQYLKALQILASISYPTLKSTFEEVELHHGDCKGADEQFNNMGVSLRFKTVSHPPINASNRAFCESDVVLTPKPYLPRNKDIVNSTDRLVATPKTLVEKGGTWHAIKYARSRGKDVIVIGPDGEIQNLT